MKSRFYLWTENLFGEQKEAPLIRQQTFIGMAKALMAATLHQECI